MFNNKEMLKRLEKLEEENKQLKERIEELEKQLSPKQYFGGK